jgi:hypothetical protein
MPLIYLDTSNISLLSHARLKEPERYGTFLRRWRSRDCALAVSYAHLWELRQYGGLWERHRRHKVLMDLRPIHTDLNVLGPPLAYGTPVEREILKAFPRSLGVSIPVRPRTELTEALPFRLTTPEEVRRLRWIELPWFGIIARMVKSAHETEADAQRHAYSARAMQPSRKAFRLEDHPAEPTADVPDVLAQTEREILRTFRKWPWILVSKRVRNQAMRTAIEPIKSLLDHEQWAGSRATFAEYLGISSPRERLDRAFSRKVWNDKVQHSLQTALTMPPDLAAKIAGALKIEFCPGAWISEQVRLEIASAEPEPDPSNGYDLQHLCFLPHVDVFLTDQRIAGYVANVLRRPGAAAIPGLKPARKTAASLQALEQVIFDYP